MSDSPSNSYRHTKTRKLRFAPPCCQWSNALESNRDKRRFCWKCRPSFVRLLTGRQCLSLLQTTPRTGIIGQDLRWKHQLVSGGPDAIHFASAIEANVAEFITNDSRLKKAKVAAVIPKLRAAGLRLIRASKTTSLPDKYRQGDILDG